MIDPIWLLFCGFGGKGVGLLWSTVGIVFGQPCQKFGYSLVFFVVLEGVDVR